MQTMRQFREAARKFKRLENLSRAELISILKECEKRLFSISVTLDNNTVPDQYKTWEQLEEITESSYEMWFYLGAIGAIRKLKGNALSEQVEEAWDSLACPLKTQRKFLSHINRIEGKARKQ